MLDLVMFFFFDLVMLLPDNGPLAIDAGRHPILESIHNDFIVSYIFLLISVIISQPQNLQLLKY